MEKKSVKDKRTENGHLTDEPKQRRDFKFYIVVFLIACLLTAISIFIYFRFIKSSELESVEDVEEAKKSEPSTTTCSTEISPSSND